MIFEAQEHAVALVGDRSSLSYLIDALNFFKVPFEVDPTYLKGWMLTVLYKNQAHIANRLPEPILCIPSNTESFHSFFRAMNVHSEYVKKRLQFNLRLRGSAMIRFCASNLYYFTGPVEVVASSGGNPLIVRVQGTDTYFLTVDLAKEMREHFEGRLDLKPSTFFGLYSWLPIMSMVPKALSNKFLGWVAHRDVSPNTYLSDMNSLDGLRYLLLAAIAISSQETVKTLGFWRKGAKYAAVITHDVDTKYGLEEGIDLLRNVERKYRVRSAWNIPIGCYKINPEVLKGLVSEGCEIGSHGYQHYGRLIFDSDNKMVKGLQESKQFLTKASRSQIKGFRAPLLQHSKRVLQASENAGFLYDSSLPAWEVHSRTDGNPHGIGTVYPLIVSDQLVEIPVTLPQDHQLLCLGGLSPEDTLELWKALIRHIKFLNGLCNVIIHPDKDLFGQKSMIGYYEEFIKEIASDADGWLTTPSEVAKWWALRNRIKTTPEGECILQLGEWIDCNYELEESIELAKYRPHDFIFE